METFFIIFVSIVYKVSYVCSRNRGEMDSVKAEIVDKCCGLFIKYGTKSITMDDIAREMGMSKKTIYQHFSDKEDVVMAFISEFTNKQNCTMQNIAEISENVIDELITSAEHMKQMISNLNPSLVFDLKKYHPKCWAEYVNFKKTHLEKFIYNTLLKGIQQGYFRKEIDCSILAKLRVEMVEICFNTEVFPQEQFSMPTVQIEAMNNFVFGICTLKGHKLLNKYKQIEEEE